MSTRNPTFIPTKLSTKRSCPKCGCEDFNGFAVSGLCTFICKNTKCGNRWQGGRGVPIDPRVPLPLESYIPPIQFEESDTEKGKIIENRRRIDKTPDFRKGAKITNEDD